MMKTTHEWVDSYVGTGLDAQAVADKLTMSGTEVEVFEEVGDDVCYTLEVTSNRTDCLSVIGLARELAATTGKTVSLPAAEYPTSQQKASDFSSIAIDDSAREACPYYTAQVIRGVKVGDSPDWLKRRLEGIGLKPINNIVDITNYVLFETGQPLHAFDLDKLAGRNVIVRLATDGERFDALIDPQRDAGRREFVKCDTQTLVIADSEKPQAIGGVMGGLTSGVTEGTVDILLESAYFEPTGNKATSRRLGIESDSSYRFERDVDKAGVVSASRRAAELIVELAGGEVLEGVLEAGECKPAARQELTLTEEHYTRLIGTDVSCSDMSRVFEGLGIEVVSSESASVTVRVPSFRRDLQRPVDLIEEISRVHGLDKIPSELSLKVSTSAPTRRQRVRRIVRERLMGFGFSEALTDTFSAKSGQLADFSVFVDGATSIGARNPVNKKLPILRRNLIQSLLISLGYNQRQGSTGAKLFEVANVFHPSLDGSSAGERELVGLVGQSYAQLKGALEHLLRGLRVADELTLENFDDGVFAGGEAVLVTIGSIPLGVMGVPSAKALKAADTSGPAAVAEFDLTTLVDAWVDVPHMQALPKFPTAERDLAFVLKESVTWEQIRKTAIKAANGTLREIEFFDEFRGKQIGKGLKSYAFRLFFRSDEATLTNEQITSQMDAVVSSIRNELGGELRG
ncbi:MAG: phenylalanine--tRNA ligase subunit beta [Planctomycetota bacterium]|jgi:phenylalanyl-tRNA synthetase beta chain